MRDPNLDDVNLLLRLYELRREEEMRKARRFLLQFQPKSVADLQELMTLQHPENAHFRQCLSYWEMVADFAARGLLHPEMFALHCGEALILYAKFEPFRDEIRKATNPRFLVNLERAVAAHPVVAERLKMFREMLARQARQQSK